MCVRVAHHSRLLQTYRAINGGICCIQFDDNFPGNESNGNNIVHEFELAGIDFMVTIQRALCHAAM